MRFWRFVLGMASVVIIPALLMAYLSMFVHPDRAWITVFFGLSYIVILLMAILLCVAWAFVSRRMFLLMLLLLIIGYPAHRSTFGFGKSQAVPDSSHSLRFVTYNVKGFDFVVDEPERDAIVDAILHSEADIVCLQEFNTFHNKPGEPDNLREISKGAGLPYYHYQKCYENKKRSRSYGIIIFSRYPVVGTGHLEYPSISKMNTTIWADLAIGGDTLRVFTSHLQSNQLTHSDFEFIGKTEQGDTLGFDSKRVAGKFRNSYIMRANQVQVIKETLNATPYPVIIAGDFNDTPVSYTYQTLKSGLEDAFLQAGRWIGPTYIPFPFIRIDYILFSPDWATAVQYQRKKIQGSDHYMVIADFELHTAVP
jgi:endonuclease/exonuclease/phosphatase family metal-dependent hydrolase